MRNDIKILIAGGDMRQVYCAAQLAERYSVSLAGFENAQLPPAAAELNTSFADGELFDVAVLPMKPLSGEGVNAPYHSGKLLPADMNIRGGGTVFAGLDTERVAELFPRQKVVSYLGREELLLKNAVLTAEGAVQLALEALDRAFSGLPVLVVGTGRIASALILILRGFGADVTAAVRSSASAARAQLLGAKQTYTDSIGGEYVLVFNTAPENVFSDTEVGRFREDTLFIELASAPGGFDDAAAELLGERLVRAPGLPGKTAPVTAGEIIAEAVSAMIEEGGAGYED
ncbi:MAG: dipicolinate synthase subunit A [Ruminococcus sp.]|nr:dipicolinate synthase subunit A [Ruminococcus sp.]